MELELLELELEVELALELVVELEEAPPLLSEPQPLKMPTSATTEAPISASLAKGFMIIMIAL